jgi:hypothetical protein
MFDLPPGGDSRVMVPALRAQTRPVPRSAAPDHAPVPGPWFRSTDHAPAPRTIVCPPDHAPAPRTFVRPDHAPAPRTTVRPDHAPAPRTTVPPHEPCSRPARLALGPSPPSGHPLLRTGPPPDQTRLDQPRPSFWPARPGLARPGPAWPGPAQPSQNTARLPVPAVLAPGQHPGRNGLPRIARRVRIRRRSGVRPRHRVRAGVNQTGPSPDATRHHAWPRWVWSYHQANR